MLKPKKLVIAGAILGAIYGIFARFVFGLGLGGNSFEVMSCAFIIGVPMALGFITIWFTDYREANNWGIWIITPWLPSLACLLCAFALLWEGLICIILLLPLILILSSVGGLLPCQSSRPAKKARALYRPLFKAITRPHANVPSESGTAQNCPGIRLLVDLGTKGYLGGFTRTPDLPIYLEIIKWTNSKLQISVIKAGHATSKVLEAQ